MGDIGHQRFPFCLFKEDGTGNIGSFPPLFGEKKDTPGDHQINRQAVFNPVHRSQLALFDLAATFQGAVIDFDKPALAVPPNPLTGVLEGVNRHGGEEHPGDGVTSLERRFFFPSATAHRVTGLS